MAEEAFSDEVRPYWGELPQVLGEWSLHWTHVNEPPRRTYDERRKHFIDEGFCPRPGCHAETDDGACPLCGWTLADEHKTEEFSIVDAPDYLPRLPLALTLDEYAAANVGEDER